MSEPSIFSILEAMLNLAPLFSQPPKVQAGGYNEEMFVSLTEEEKEELSCGICYQILRDTRSCENGHKFCYTCIYVWSTSGPLSNHSRCPVCRTDGHYFRYRSLDERINGKTVKCGFEGCSWSGPLKELSSHRHTTYDDENENAEQSTDLPSISPQNSVRNRGRRRIVRGPNQTTSPRRGQGQSTQSQTGTDTSSNRRTQASNIPVRTNARQVRTNSNGDRAPNGQGQERTRSSGQPLLARRRSSQPSGDNGDAAAGGGGDAAAAAATTSTEVTNSVHVPRPPTTPRPPDRNTRRTPSLPSIVNSNNAQQGRTSTNGSSATSASTSPTRNVNATGLPTPRRLLGARSRGRNDQVRERLEESRSRLDSLMRVFSTELERSRQEVADFQEERERLRMEQLEEVRELGDRLGSIAVELRTLLQQRRTFIPFNTNMSEEDVD